MAEEHLHQDEVQLPEQVRRQAARANELLTRSDRDDEAPQLTTETNDDGSLQVVERPPQEEETPAPPAPDATGWEQRYRTLQGKYDSELPSLRAQVHSLERLIATMQQAAPRETARRSGQPLTFEEGDVDIYGQDFLEASARAAAARYEPEIADLRAQIARLEGGQQNIASQNLQNTVFTELGKDPQLAGWEQVNHDPRFHQWLQEIDEYAGVPRNQMLQHAYLSGDAIRTGRFFKRYMAEHTVPRTAATSPQTGLTPRPNGNGHMVSAGGARLEDMVVPGRAAGPGGGSGNGAHNPRIWSRSEISRFYRERTDGKWRGREAESEQLERDILAASTEGRIH